MNKSKWVLGGLALLFGVVAILKLSPRSDLGVDRAPITAAPGRSAKASPPLLSFAAARQEASQRDAKPSGAVARPTPSAPKPAPTPVDHGTYAEFNAWALRFIEAAGQSAPAGASIEEGLRLAMARREILAQEIQSNPKRALAQAIPWRWRQQLPPEISAYLEEAVSGQGRLDVYCAQPLPGSDYREFKHGEIRYATIDGRTYRAYVYGRRLAQMTQKSVSLHGIAIGNVMAVHEDPVRVLDTDEAASVQTSAKAPASTSCGVCGVASQIGRSGVTVEYAGRFVTVCSGAHASELNLTLVAAEANARAALASAPASPGGENPIWTTPPPADAAATYGARRVLYMRVVFPDDTRVPISQEEAEDVLNRASEFYVEASYNKTALIPTVTPVLTLSYPKLNYSFEGPGALLEDALVKAAEAGFWLEDYNFLVVRHPSVPGFDWGGLGGGSGDGGAAWLQSSDVGTLIHELGHVYGLGHANFWETRRPELPANPNNLPFDIDSLVGHDSVIGVGDDIAYGDTHDVMGSGGGEAANAGGTNAPVSGLVAHFNPIGKNALGWLGDAYVVDVVQNSTNRIYAHDAPRLYDGRHYALKVRKDAQRTYWVSARGKVTSNQWLTNGVELHWANWPQAQGYSELLDTTPGTKAGREDGSIAVGRTYADEESKIYITPIAHGGVGSDSWYDLVVNLGVASANQPPVVDLTASTNAIRVGGAVTLTATASDPNADALSYYWQFGDGSPGQSTPSVQKIYTQAGEYVVRVEVSDRRGGMTSKHMVITVGSPSTLRISGFVVDSLGAPLQGVRVSNGSLTADPPYDFLDDYQATYTDADGAFTLVNLTNRSYPIGAFLNGYKTRPLNFETPVNLVDRDATDLQFLAVPLPRVTVTKVSDADGVNGTAGQFLLKRTGDTNTSLPVVFAFGGSAVPKTDFTNNTVTVSHTNVVPTPFGPATVVAAFYGIEFATGVVQTNVLIGSKVKITNSTEKEVALSLMYPLQTIQYSLTNGDAGVLVTNTNVFFFSDWEIRTVNGQDTWFQNYSEYVPYAPAEAKMKIKGTTPVSPVISVFAMRDALTENPQDAGLFTFTRSGRMVGAVNVLLEISGTALNGSDYETIHTNLTIPANTEFVNLPVVARQDNYLEGNETVVIKILADPAQGYEIGQPSATITIGDDDLSLVTIQTTDGYASELGNDSGTITVSRRGTLTDDLVVNYLVTGDAVASVDYRALSGSVTIPAGQPNATILIQPRDNGVRDGGKTVTIFLSDSPTYNVGRPNSASVFIRDRALPVVRVTTTDDTATEPADTGEFTITRTGDLSRELIVEFRTGGTAKPHGDYASLGTRVRIPPQQSSVTLLVTPTDDRIREDQEVVILELLPTSNYNIDPNAYQASVNLNDEDSGSLPAVGFNFLTSSVSELDGSARIAVSVSANPAENMDVTVDYKVEGGTALPDVDYPLTTSTGRLVFPHNANTGKDAYTNRTQLIEFPITDNTILQGDRTVILTLLAPPSYISNWITTNEISITNDLGEAVTTNQIVTNQMVIDVPMNANFDVYKQHTLTILDDDAAIVTVEATDPEAREQGLDPGMFTIRRQGPTNRAQLVTLQMSGYAANGSDYQPIPNTLVIPVGASSIDVPVLPVDDPIQEFLEDVTMTLITAPGAQIGASYRATVHIVDNDGTVEFTQTAYTATESVGVAQIPVRRTGDTNATASVEFLVTAGTATADADFVATNGTLVFARGETLKQIPVTILDDLIVEPNETIQLRLRNRSDGAPMGGQSTAVLNILDDDTAIEFAQAVYRANENGTNALITLRRLGLVDKTVQVDFLATNGTAEDLVDFVATNRTVVFAAGVTNLTVGVRLLDDIVFETNETVLLTLATNTTSTASIGPQATATLVIADDECTIDFAAAEYRVQEYARIVTLNLQRLGGTVNTVGVDFATSNLTATAGSDYVAAQSTVYFAGDTNVLAADGSGTLVFQPGETNKAIQIQILDDSLGEGNETFLVSLSNARGPTRGALPGSTVLGVQTNTVVTILDDETPGAVDFAFNPGQGTDGPVYAVGVQSDGKVLVGGNFSSVDGVVLSYMARLHEDGYLDSFFNPGAGFNGAVHALALQADGRILVGGAFTRFNGTPVNRFIRLNADGIADPDFRPGFGANGLVRAIAVGPDGRLVLGGDFSSVDGITRNGIVRLNANGSIDSSFDPGAGAGGSVYAIAVQPDNKIVVGGAFSSMAGANTPYLARLNADGTPDKAFAIGLGPDAAVRSIAVASDGRVVLGGAFTSVNNLRRGGVARLNADGSVDSSFDPGTGADGEVYAVGVQSDGKVLIAGEFANVVDGGRNRFARLNPNGTLDAGFDVGTGANATVRTLALQPNSALVIGGDFTQVNGLDRKHIARIHGDEKFVLSKIEFSAASYRVPENSNLVTITVVRSGDITSAATVDFATADGTATAGFDYQATNGTLRFASGETQATFAVPILDDTLAEGDETVLLTLSNLPPGYTLTARLTATLTIVDDESAIAFSATSYSVGEGDGQATISVRRTGPSGAVATVDYQTTEGSAQPGVDYEPTSGTLQFGVGEVEKSFTVTILEDTETEPDETIGLVLTNITGGPTLGVQSNAVLTIVDNDRAEFYSLNITPPVGGTVTPASGPYPVGSTQVLTATADRDYAFVRWDGTVSSTANPLTVVMDQNYTLTAFFAPINPTYTFEPPFSAGQLQLPPWVNGSASPWVLQSATAAQGRFALRSGAIGNRQETVLDLVVDTRAGAVSFDYRVSSEANWDFLELWINGARIQRWSGELPWRNYQFNVAAGRNQITWRYVKDANFSAGLDGAFIDNLYIPYAGEDPTPPAAVLAITSYGGEAVNIRLTGKAGLTYVLEASSDFIGWTPVATNVLQGTSTFIQQPIGPANRYYRAVTR